MWAPGTGQLFLTLLDQFEKQGRNASDNVSAKNYAPLKFSLDPRAKSTEKAVRPRVEFMMKKMEAIGRTMGAAQVWRAPLGPGAPGAHHEGGTRMGSDPKNSVVNRYGQSWDVPNPFVIGSSTFPSMSGFNPTLTIQALAYMSADAIVNRYRKTPGSLL